MDRLAQGTSVSCDSAVIKPEVSAPGVSVRSTYANGSYGSMSGTSMAAPHVSGAVALLRQVNPNADADQIKLALLLTARDLGTPGEDNSYGMGLIDVFAAAEMVTPYRLTGTVRAAGTGLPLRNASVAVLQTGQDRKTDSAGAYLIAPLKDTVLVRFSAFAYRDTTISVILAADVPLVLNVDLPLLPLSSVSGSVTDSAGGTGIAADVRWFAQGDSSGGPTYTVTTQPDGAYTLQALAGTYRVEVVPPAPYPDRVTIAGVIVTPSGATLHIQLPPSAVVMVDDDKGAMYDTLYRKSLERLGVSTRTVSLAAGSAVLDTLLDRYAFPPVLVWFTGTDSAGAMTVEERRIVRGHFEAGGNAIITGQNIAQFAPSGDTLLQSVLGIQFTGNTTQLFLRGFTDDVIGNGVNFLLSGGASNQNSKDVLQTVPGSTGIPTGTLYYGSDTAALAGVRVLGPGSAWLAVYFGFGLEVLPASRMDTLLARSFRYFANPVSAVDEPGAPGIPRQMMLAQNYPNPFNGQTRIGYRIQGDGGSRWVTLTVYDVLGREVARLVNGLQEPGEHMVGFDAAGLPSGVYVYRLNVRPRSGGDAGATSIQRKMLLLK